MAKDVKSFYAQYHDSIAEKRFNSPYWLRRYTHRRIHSQFLPYLSPGMRVLDAGCGEGVLTILAAQHEVELVGVDISAPNIEAAVELAEDSNSTASFLQADLESLPFDDSSFDIVMASHVLEHLPSLITGLKEVHRVTNDLALIAMPTCLNPACWVLLGGDNYWKLGRRSLFALTVGMSKLAAALLRSQEGPNEGYAGSRSLPHIWRFPWIMRKQLEAAGFFIERFEAGPFILPYVAEYLPVVRAIQPRIDQLNTVAGLKNLGYGSMAVCRKR